MQRLKALGLAVLAACALASVASAPAQAGELPEFTVATASEGTGGSATIETLSGTKVTCASSADETTATTKKSGTFHISFKECSSSGFKCNSTGDAAGVVLASGEWALVSSGAEPVYLLLSPSEVHLECTALVKLVVKGTLLTAITPVSVETTKYELAVTMKGGDPTRTEYENDAGGKVKAQLLASINGGAFEGAGIESTAIKLTTAAATEIKGPLFGVKDALGGLKVKVGAEPALLIENVSNKKKIMLGEILRARSAAFTFPKEAAEVAACLGKVFEPKDKCEIHAKYEKKEANSFVTVEAVDQNKRAAKDTLLGE